MCGPCRTAPRPRSPTPPAATSTPTPTRPARRITPGTRPAATDFDYNNNDKRTETVHPGGTTQTVTIDDNGRPARIKTTSGTQTFVDLSYSYASAGKDTTKIRTRTDNIPATRPPTPTTPRTASATPWKPTGPARARPRGCTAGDKAANLTSQDGSRNTCPGGTTYTYNDASELTGKNGSTTGWAYDKLGNETAGAGGTGRTTESWTDYSQLAGITADGTTYAGDRGAEVVVTDLAGRDAAQHAESVDVAFEERLLAAGGEDAVHGLVRIRQAHREHEAGDQLTGQAYLHVAEVHLGPRPVGLRDKRVHHAAAGLNSDLGRRSAT